MPSSPILPLQATLAQAADGDPAALQAVFPQVYATLRDIAAAYMRHERANHTLQATALVGEAYLRLAGDGGLRFNDNGHLVGLAARAMRQVLVDHARGRSADKRGAGVPALTLSAADDVPDDRGEDVSILALDAALSELEAHEQRQAKIVQLRYFAGLSIEQTAQALALSPATVKREWTLARLWLRRSLRDA